MSGGSTDMPMARFGRLRYPCGHLSSTCVRHSATGIITNVLGTSPFLVQGDIRIAIAREKHQFDACARLVADRYGWRGYEVPAPIMKNPSYFTILASCPDGHLVGTLTLGLDSPTGLMVDDMYKEEVDVFRKMESRVCELVRLAVEPGDESKHVLLSLFHMAYLCLRLIHGMTDAFIEVNPRHVAYYKRIIGFDTAGPPKNCPRVNAPAVLLRLNLENVHQATQDFVNAVIAHLEEEGYEPRPWEEDTMTDITGMTMAAYAGAHDPHA